MAANEHQWQQAEAQLNLAQTDGQQFICWEGGDLIKMSFTFIDVMMHVDVPLNAIGFQFDIGVYRVEIVDEDRVDGLFLCRRLGYAQAVQ